MIEKLLKRQPCTKYFYPTWISRLIIAISLVITLPSVSLGENDENIGKSKQTVGGGKSETLLKQPTKELRTYIPRSANNQLRVMPSVHSFIENEESLSRQKPEESIDNQESRPTQPLSSTPALQGLKDPSRQKPPEDIDKKTVPSTPGFPDNWGGLNRR